MSDDDCHEGSATGKRAYAYAYVLTRKRRITVQYREMRAE